MKLRITILFFFFLTTASEIFAFSSKENYLWIEYKKQVKEKDGSVTLPLQINYGIFPNDKKDISKLENIKVFYSYSGTNNGKNRILYQIKIEKDNGKNLIEINSPATNRFTVFVEAEKTEDKTTLDYLAKTSFILFGHAASNANRIFPVPAPEFNRQLEIFITPEFYYWPQTNSPIKISSAFNNVPLAKKDMSIFDENMPVQEIITDEKGSCTYLPPDDKKLNWQGETAFKQSLITMEESEGNIKYISSYTLLLHRSRFKNNKVLGGIILFLVSAICIFLYVMIKRAKFIKSLPGV